MAFIYMLSQFKISPPAHTSWYTLQAVCQSHQYGTYHIHIALCPKHPCTGNSMYSFWRENCWMFPDMQHDNQTRVVPRTPTPTIHYFKNLRSHRFSTSSFALSISEENPLQLNSCIFHGYFYVNLLFALWLAISHFPLNVLTNQSL
jgi:hypothetical protein